jgi:hypothetical protein
MKKLIIAGAGIGAVLALRQVTKQSGHTMREHCKEMAGHCKQTMGTHAEGAAEASRMREHCGRGQTTARDEERSEPVATV